MEQNIFEVATRKNFPFPTSRGIVLVQQLWQMPLTSKDDFNLDKVAQTINTELEATTEKSFVKVTPNAKAKDLKVMLDIIVHIIGVKLEEKAVIAKRIENNAKRDKLMDLLSKKQDAALESKSEEEIKAELKALDDAE